MTLNPIEILLPVLLRLALALVGLTSLLRSRMEVSAPPTSFDHISDTTFLLQSGTDPSSLPYVPAILLPFYKITGGGILPAVFLGATADAISGAALYLLARSLDLTKTDAGDVATLFLWNPLSIASCVSGSADPLRLSAVFVAAAAAAAGKSLAIAGASLALALHFSSSEFSSFSPMILMVIPLVSLYLKNQQKQKKSSGINNNMSRTRHGNTSATASTNKKTAATTPFVAASFTFLVGFLVTSTILGSIAPSYLTYTDSPSSSRFERGAGMAWLNKIFIYFSRREDDHHQRDSAFSSSSSFPPWSNIEPNLGLQWYLFAEVLPPFRYLYDYVFWAICTGLCFSIALHFSSENPLEVMVAQSIVLCMLSRHPTYSDIMMWVGLLPLVLVLQKKKQEVKKEEDDEGGVGKYLKMWLAVGFCISLGLNTAAYEVR
jgi:GPI transamidase subunit PIG-U